MTASSPDVAFVPDSEDQGVARLQKLSNRVASLRSRAKGAGGDWDRYLLIGGGTGFALGLLFICLGAYGASRTVLLFEQIPYLVSGGLLGLGLVVAGGFVYWSYWQTTLVREGRAERADLVAGLARLEAVLERSLAAPAAQSDLAEEPGALEVDDDELGDEPYDEDELYARPTARSGRRQAAAESRTSAGRSSARAGITTAARTTSSRGGANSTRVPSGRSNRAATELDAASARSNGTRRAAKPTTHRGPRLVATASGTMLHRPDCTVVARRDNLRDVDARTPGMTGCQLCDPLADD